MKYADVTREAALFNLASLQIPEYGVYGGTLHGRIEAQPQADALVAALNNADTDGVLLALLRENPEKIFDGMDYAAVAAGTDTRILHIPEYAAALAEAVAPAARARGIEVEVGIVDCRKHEKSVLTHIVTMAELADALAGTRTEGVYVAVNGGKLQKVPADTKVGDLLEGSYKAVQTGYTLRGCEAARLTVAAANLQNAVLRQYTDRECLVAEMERQLLADRKQSCGKCVFCREGLIQLDEMHRDMTGGKGKFEYLDRIKEIGTAMGFSTMCSLGQKAAALPLAAAAQHAGEYEAHIKKHVCPAEVCEAFVHVYIDPKACTGCGKCVPVCPAECIDGMDGYIHLISEFECTKCGKCAEICPEGAVHITRNRVPKLPDRFIRAGKFQRR